MSAACRAYILGCDLPRDGDLGPSVAELGEGGVEEAVLLPKRFITVFRGARLLCLEGHVGVRDLGDVGHEENKSEDEDEDRDGEVDPLHVLQRLYVVEVKEDIGPQDGGHHRADAIEGLRDVDPDLRVLGRATDCKAPGSALDSKVFVTGGGCQGQRWTYR